MPTPVSQYYVDVDSNKQTSRTQLVTVEYGTPFEQQLSKSTNMFIKFDVHRAVHRNIISIVKPTRYTNVSNLFYFGNNTLHVSDGLSVHHQQFKTVHTATDICQTDTAVCLVVGTRWNGVQYCTYSNRHMSNRYCCLLASGYEMERSSRLYIQQQTYVKQILLSAS